MKKCLKITFTTNNPGAFLHNFIQQNARSLSVEGTAQISGGDSVTIMACGLKNNIDVFLDIIHQGFESYKPENIYVEPFLKEKDYRGIFRIIE